MAADPSKLTLDSIKPLLSLARPCSDRNAFECEFEVLRAGRFDRISANFPAAGVWLVPVSLTLVACSSHVLTESPILRITGKRSSRPAAAIRTQPSKGPAKFCKVHDVQNACAQSKNRSCFARNAPRNLEYFRTMKT
jgi:hypothetical protein